MESATPLKETLFVTIEAQFRALVSPCPITGCHWWVGAHGDRYGFFSFDGRQRGAHVVAWMLAHGRLVPSGKCILHVCDFTLCVNPAHLWLGTKAENSADMVAKRRQACGFKLPGTRFTLAEIESVFTLRASGLTQVAVARKLGMSVSYVSMIERGERKRVA